MKSLTKTNVYARILNQLRGDIVDNSILKKICGSISYNAYTNLQNTLCMSSIGLAVANNLIIPQNTMINNSIDGLIYITIATYLGFAFSNGRNYTKDMNQINVLYQEFLNNYNKLNKIFDLNDPVQIHTMFNYLLYKGYLSKDKKFQFSSENARDIDVLSGTNVIAGKAVCRHISAMLTDILNNYGIESHRLGVYSKDYNINIKILEQLKYTKEELINWVRTHITDENTYDFVMRIIEELVDNRNQHIEISYEMEDNKNPLVRKAGNHAITFALKDGKSYFLDPTQTRIYRMSETDKGILYDDECDNIPIRLTSSIVLNNSKDYRRLREHLLKQYPSISREQENAMVKQTLNICDTNMDIFEQFYSDNSELYDDISSKLLKIRKTKSILK